MVHLSPQPETRRNRWVTAQMSLAPRIGISVSMSVKVASQTSLFAWYFQRQSFTTFLHRRVCFKTKCSQRLHCSAGSGDILFFSFFNLFILLLAALGLCCCTGFFFHLVVKGGSCCSLTASHCGAFYCCKAQALGRVSFRSCRPWALECRVQQL